MTNKILQRPKYWLTLEDCERIFEDFKKLVEYDEVIPPFNTRSEGKLESIIGSVSQTYGGEYLNPTILDASSAYLNQFIRGHPFRNGNKRMAIIFTHAFLLANGVDLSLTSNELSSLALSIAMGGKYGKSGNETKELAKTVIRNFSIEYK